MIGVDAITGGLIGIVVFAALTLIALLAVAVSIVLLFKRRYLLGTAPLVAGIALGAWLIISLWKIFVPTEDSLAIDLTRPTSNPLNANTRHCIEMPLDEVHCFANADVTKLTIKFPDGRLESVEARSLHTRTRGKSLRVIAFMPPSAVSMTDLQKLIDAHIARAPSGNTTDWQKAQETLRSGKNAHSDVSVLFTYPGYDIRVWVLPRDGTGSKVSYWYEIHLE